MAKMVAMVLAGGVALGAYQAGAFAAMGTRYHERLRWIAGSSIGAVNAAIIAGNAPDQRIAALDGFWAAAASPSPFDRSLPSYGPWRQIVGWLSIAQSRTLGRAGLFAPQLPTGVLRGEALGLYQLKPLIRRLERFVDFERLNAGALRVSVITTDIDTGEPVIFDTQTDVIQPAHLVASCGLLPAFEPTEIEGRLLGDGGLAANAPVELVLADQAGDQDLVCFVVDLFARDLGRPTSLYGAAERLRDLLLSNPTHRALDGLGREDALRRLLAVAAEHIPRERQDDPAVTPLLQAARRGATTVLHLSYAADSGETGPESQFDFSSMNLCRRREAGAQDMTEAMARLQQDAEDPVAGFRLHRIRRHRA